MRKNIKYFTIILLILILSLTNINTQIENKNKEKNSFTKQSQLEKINKILMEKSLEDLKLIAQKLENYWYAKRGGLIFGGLHDYIDKISKEDLVKFCLDIIEKNQELIDFEKFNIILISITKPKLFLDKKEKQNEYQKEIFLGGLHDYIFKVEKKTLLKWALAAEAYKISLNSFDKNKIYYINYLKNSKIWNMSKNDLVKFTLDQARIYKILDNGDNLDKFAEIFGVKELIDNKNKENLKSLKENLAKLDRETLKKYAFACEFFERKGEKLLGGLHDYIFLLSDEEIRKYIIEKAEKYEELNTLEKLEEIFLSKENKLKFLYEKINAKDI